MSRSMVMGMLRAAAQRQDLVLVAILILTISMMIMPIPTPVADMLIGCNLGVSVLLLMVAIYLRSPLDLTALPGIILVSTVFRLALEVAITRMILTQGDAGAIVETFGQFVIGGNIVVGLVVFMIITTVQFIVITKGTERVAEVGARFTLDALPGKQMSVDSDLRSGDIDQAEARRRRHDVERESALHGAMDGAMKFVKGDSVAGLIIIMVNLVGGISIGAGQHGMALSDALQTYTLLTVGDALISQIPALLISLTAAVVVTRVGGQGIDLGRDMVGQLVANTQAMRLSAVVLIGMALIPGFPKPVFLILAMVFIAASRPDWSRLARLAGRTRSQPEPVSASPLPVMAHPNVAEPASLLAISLSPALDAALRRDRLEALIATACAQVEADLGIRCPKAAVRVRTEWEGTRYSIDLEDVPLEENELRPDRVLLRDDAVHLELAGIEAEPGPPLLSRQPSFWVAASEEARLRAACIGFSDASSVIAARLRRVLRRHAPRFLGLQESKQLVQRLEADYGDLVREATRLISAQKMGEVLRRLVEEEVSLRNMRLILETLVEWGERESRPVLLVEHVRQALARQICHRYANPQKLLSAYVLAHDTEQLMRQSTREMPAGSFLALESDMSERLVAAIAERFKEHDPDPGQPIIVASVDVRRLLRGLLVQNGLDVAILSYQDLAPEFPVHPIGPIGIRTADVRASAEAAGRAAG
ncbi:MAG: type III secretion system export apparatus subunit SctV [Janthinobacterium lividum]